VISWIQISETTGSGIGSAWNSAAVDRRRTTLHVEAVTENS
jgi:hypothetical protein